MENWVSYAKVKIDRSFLFWELIQGATYIILYHVVDRVHNYNQTNFRSQPLKIYKDIEVTSHKYWLWIEIG